MRKTLLSIALASTILPGCSIFKKESEQPADTGKAGTVSSITSSTSTTRNYIVVDADGDRKPDFMYYVKDDDKVVEWIRPGYAVTSDDYIQTGAKIWTKDIGNAAESIFDEQNDQRKRLDEALSNAYKTE